MALYLVQHGACFPKERDPQRGLTPEGRADVERIASVAAGYGVRPARILHSGKHRAQQTAELIAAHLAPPCGVDARSGIDPLDDVEAVARDVDPLAGVMLVGHLPFIERLAALLVTGDAERPAFRFQNGGIVCLDLHPDTGTWVIHWALMPHVG